MRKRKIVYLVGTLHAGGLERLVTEWCLFLLRETDWQPVVICLLNRKGTFLQVLEKSGVEVFQCKLKNTGFDPFALRLARMLRSIRPDVVHSQVAFSIPWQVLGIKLGRVKTIIFTQHNEYQNWNYFLPRLRIIAYFALVRIFITEYTCVSERVRNAVSKLTLTRPNFFQVIPNAVDTRRFHPKPDQKHSSRASIGVENDDIFLFGTVARFSQQKGHRYLIEACALLRDKGYRFKLALAGAGDLQNDLERQVVDRALNDQISFIGVHESVDFLLQAFDGFVLPSLWEGMPIALLEAMACGVPVIATDISGTHEIIRSGSNGLLVKPADPRLLADACAVYLDKPDFRNKMASAGVATIEEKFTIHACMMSYLRLYNQRG